MINVIARVVENDNGYRFPSGGKFKQRKEDAKRRDPKKKIVYADLMGFGHEEWNFNKALAVNGQLRGYHYYQPAKKKRHDLFTIYFVTYVGSEWRLVGAYRNARFLDGNAIKRAPLPRKRALQQLARSFQLLDAKGGDGNQLGKMWRGRSVDQLISLLEKADLRNRRWVVNVDDIVVAEQPILLYQDLPLQQEYRTNFRETTPTFISLEDASLLDRLLERGAVPKISSKAGSKAGGPTPDDVQQWLSENPFLRFTPEQRKEIVPRHNKLSNCFRGWLEEAGATDIEPEARKVDVQCKLGKSSCLFELKICAYGQTTRYAIRDALGQILEYSLFPGRPPVNFSAVVLDAKPSDAEIAWCRAVGEQGMPVEIFWVVGKQVHAAGLVAHPLSRRAL